MINFRSVAQHLQPSRTEDILLDPERIWSGNIFGAMVTMSRMIDDSGGEVIFCVVTASEVLCQNLKFLLERDLGPAKEQVEDTPDDPIHALIDEIRDQLLKEEMGAIQRVFTWPVSVLAKSAFGPGG